MTRYPYLDSIEDCLKYIVVGVVRSACFTDLVGGPAKPGWRYPLWTEIKRISKGFVEARDQISTGHENLRTCVSPGGRNILCI